MAKDPHAETRALKHGAAGAERKLSTGQEFTGLALEAQQAVSNELETDGIPAVFRRRVERMQGAADLYWAAICGTQDIEKLDRFMQRWAWLQGSALRNLVVLHDLQKKQSDQDITALLRGTDGD